MNKKWIVVSTAVIVIVAFVAGAAFFESSSNQAVKQGVQTNSDNLVRPHSPVFGNPAAKVTIVEFFDPACETCRAFYPIVKQIMAQHPDKVRLALRDAPFHHGSDQVVKLIEAARKQGLYTPVLEALLAAQPEWADHAAPNIGIAFEAAARAGLDMERARQDMETPEIQAVLAQDIEDLTALQVSKTPTFFVNGRSLPSFGPEQLARLVAEEVGKVRR